MGMHFARPWVDCQRDMEQVRASWPQPDSIPEATRAEQRFAAEVSIAQLRGELVPTYAVERANTILQLMARA